MLPNSKVFIFRLFAFPLAFFFDDFFPVFNFFFFIGEATNIFFLILKRRLFIRDAKE